MKAIPKHHICIYLFSSDSQLKQNLSEACVRILRTMFSCFCGGSAQLRLVTTVSLRLVIKKERQGNDLNGFGRLFFTAVRSLGLCDACARGRTLGVPMRKKTEGRSSFTHTHAHTHKTKYRPARTHTRGNRHPNLLTFMYSATAHWVSVNC